MRLDCTPRYRLLFESRCDPTARMPWPRDVFCHRACLEFREGAGSENPIMPLGRDGVITGNPQAAVFKLNWLTAWLMKPPLGRFSIKPVARTIL